MFANEMTYSSFAFMNIGLESSPAWLGMLAESCGLTSAGMVAGSNATLCGPPETMMNLMPSPAFTVMSAGSKR